MTVNPHPRITFAAAMLTALVVSGLSAPALEAQPCSGQDPAFPVPSNLWLTGLFRPGSSDLPGDQIPAERDSTTWVSFTIPGFSSGHELFLSVDAVGDYLYVAYNAGFSVWNIAGANAEDPERVAVRDGWYNTTCQTSSICGPFLTFPDVAGHDYFQVDDVDVLAEGAIHYIAVSGKGDVGTSLWQFNTSTRVLTPIYQDSTRISRQVRLAKVDGRIYVFASGNNALPVYDLTRALVIAPCLEETAIDCPGVYLGNLGTLSTGRYLDVLQRPNGDVLVATSDGDASSLGLQLWKVPNPGTPAVATRLFNGLDPKTFGTALFNYESNDYLAALVKDGTSNKIKIYNVNACNGPCSLGSPVYTHSGVPPRISDQFLTYSNSNGTPFLYYGVYINQARGTKIEQLLNLTTLGRPSQNITEMTDGGPTYFDDCEQANVDYWGWYYPGNEFGLNNLTPLVGKFHPTRPYFYRAANGVIDAHVWEAGVEVDPTVVTTVVNPDPEGLYWLTDELTFEAEGAEGCEPEGVWTWTALTPPEIDAVTVNETGNQVTYRFECATRGTSRCDDAPVSVSATNSDPTCDGADVTVATVTVKDPSLEIVSITPDGGTFTQCGIVTFEAELLGRGPVGYAWKVQGFEAEAGTVPEEDLSTATLQFDWDTSDVTFDEIFSDGFESGDTSAWTGLRLGTLPINIELELADGLSESVALELSPVLGDPEFGVPAIVFTTLDNSSFDFHANTVVGTVSEWTWELEDDDGASLCTFGADVDVPCTVLSGQDVSHTWFLQNGDRRVDLTIANCQSELTQEASTTVSVVATEELEIATFKLDRVLSIDACDIDDNCLFDLVCTCHVDETVFLEVVSSGGATVYDFDWNGDGTFEDTDNPVDGTVYSNVYATSVGEVVPGVRARRGAAPPAEEDLRETLDIQP